jgi:predicted dehydrogenase
MREYLRLLADRRVRVQSLITARYAIDDATAAYASLTATESRPLMVLLTYEGEEPPVRTMVTGAQVSSIPRQIRVAVLGAGSFARSIHLPNLQALPDRFAIHAVVTRDGHKAKAVAAQFGAAHASTSTDEVLADPDVDAVIIATRHHLHAELALAALRANKHVLVEKPTALSRDELDALDDLVNRDDGPSPLLMTGYNRRFSPYAECLAGMLRERSGPFMISYRMNAGYISLEHWVHGPNGGGRNLGEACHIYDLFTFLTGSAISEVSARSIRPAGGHYSRTDNFIATLRFAEGSVASLTYTALGNPGLPKEMADLHVDGQSVVLRDYRALEVFGRSGLSFKSPTQDKGFARELVAFADGIRDGKWPIPWWQQKQVADIALSVDRLLAE